MKPDAIVVHCSASEWGDAAVIRQWHQEKGWSDIGYHAVILNGYRTSRSIYSKALDGKIEPGRKETVMGSHCKADNMNGHSLGVCLIGMPGKRRYPSSRQIDALVHYCAVECIRYGIQSSAITQHSDHEPLKPHCASLNMADIRRRVHNRILEMRKTG